jgi:ribonucleoside-diphosphate reductase alpha chain
MTKTTFNNFDWCNEEARTFLSRGYLTEGQTVEERVSIIANAAANILELDDFAPKFYAYMSKGFYSLSSPIWSNFGNDRGLPISCNSSYIPDTMEGILHKQAEVGMMTKHGAGTSAFFGDVRERGAVISRGGHSNGAVHFMELFDCVTNTVSQSNVRRGSFAAYLPVEHPDIKEFLQIRSEGHSIQDISIGVTITDKWMQDMIGGDDEKRQLWGAIIRKRFETGYPYIFFSDTVNNNAPQVYKDKGHTIHNSNLCSEIALSSSEEESYVCNLSSMNMLTYDEWKETDAVEVLTYFLDAVMSEYIEKTNDIPFMDAPNRFARNQRALGIGTLGWHSLLQSKMISFESMEAKFLNMEIHKFVQEHSFKASEEMAERYGEPELLQGTGRRNVTTMAIAPTTSSSFILGQVSPSIEPLNSNYFVKDLAKGKFTFKNPFLIDLLEEKEKNTPETWKSILTRGGSVQHLDFLTQDEKDVFKTFGEISQKEIVIQAAQRQKFIDQSQSLNLMLSPDTPAKDASQLLVFGWEQGVKTFYYQRSANPAQELSRNILNCTSCEG